jgi:hypothetical protein
MKLVAAAIISAIIIPPLLIAAAIWDVSRYWDDAQWEWEDE